MTPASTVSLFNAELSSMDVAPTLDQRRVLLADLLVAPAQWLQSLAIGHRPD